MEKTTDILHFTEQGVTAQCAFFQPSTEAVAEWHVMLHVESRGELFARQITRIYEAEEALMRLLAFQGAQCVMKRFFLSDSANQASLLRKEADNVAVSIIQQQPLDGSKVAVWLYLQRGTEVTSEHGAVCARHEGYEHIWQMGLHSNEGNSAQQTERLLTDYEDTLRQFGATLADNCIRTWFFVRDVDTQYAGLVRARRENFTEQGLTPETHYIASTGIGGAPADTKALIQLGTYALKGFLPQQQRYLYAPTHLNPTYEYGVTFERGVDLEFGDRCHVYISGTASINNKGEVVHVGNIVEQTHRMWENVETLLREANTTFDDVMQIIVYLRDTADYDLVRALFQERFPNTPTVITLAPVCRPTWLIEMECIAVKQRNNAQFRPF